MEGMKLVGQPWYETVVVVDHAEEALETGLVGRHRTASTLDSRGRMPEVVTRCPR